LGKVEQRYAEIETLLSDPAVATDPRRLRDLSKERAALGETTRAIAEHRRLEQTIADDREAAESDDAELAELARAELPELQARREAVENDRKRLLLPRDPDDDKDVIVEIRAGTGGGEASLFAADLHRMYAKYAERNGWRLEEISRSESDVGGLKEIIFQL